MKNDGLYLPLQIRARVYSFRWMSGKKSQRITFGYTIIYLYHFMFKMFIPCARQYMKQQQK